MVSLSAVWNFEIASGLARPRRLSRDTFNAEGHGGTLARWGLVAGWVAVERNKARKPERYTRTHYELRVRDQDWISKRLSLVTCELGQKDLWQWIGGLRCAVQLIVEIAGLLFGTVNNLAWFRIVWLKWNTFKEVMISWAVWLMFFFTFLCYLILFYFIFRKWSITFAILIIYRTGNGTDYCTKHFLMY